MWGKFQFRSGLRKSVDSKPTTSIRSLKLESLEDRSVPSAVSFVRVDTTTQGNWLGAYGRDGESLAGSSTQIPNYAQVNASLPSTRIWSESTSDVRALETANGEVGSQPRGAASATRLT